MQTDDSVSVVNTREQATETYPIDEELIARRWLKKKGYYWASRATLANHFFHHFMSIARMPRGGADKAGSQQCAFTMPVPSR